MSEEVNRKCPPRNTILLLSTPNTDPELSLPPRKFPRLTTAIPDNGLYRVIKFEQKFEEVHKVVVYTVLCNI